MMVTDRARASMLFSTNSAIAFRGLPCDRAMMVMAFQSSPMRSLPVVPRARRTLYDRALFPIGGRCASAAVEGPGREAAEGCLRSSLSRFFGLVILDEARGMWPALARDASIYLASGDNSQR